MQPNRTLSSMVADRRRLVPLLLSIVLFCVVLSLAWLKLRQWRGPELVLGTGLIGAYLTWIGLEAHIALRDAKATSVREDHWTAEVYAVAQGSTVIAALWFESSWPLPATLCLTLGASAFVSGFALRWSAIRALGAFYSHRVQVTAQHRVVQTGPFAWVRHPAYAGMLLAHCGFVCCFFNGVAMAVLVAGLLPAVVRRIQIEERALACLPEYERFCRTRARLVPSLW